MDDTKSLGAERLSPVYFTTMSHSHDPHGLRFLINLIKDTIVSNSTASMADWRRPVLPADEAGLRMT